MSKIEQLQAITKIANEKLELEQDIDNEEFFNGDLFKTILSDFEKNALEVAQRGESTAFIRLDEYFNCDIVQGNGESLLKYAMEKTGYMFSIVTNIGGYTLGFSW